MGVFYGRRKPLPAVLMFLLAACIRCSLASWSLVSIGGFGWGGFHDQLAPEGTLWFDLSLLYRSVFREWLGGTRHVRPSSCAGPNCGQ